MEAIIGFVQFGLDAGTLALCCEAVFRKKTEAKAKDLLLFPILLVLCIVPGVNFVADQSVTAEFTAQGAAIVPTNSIAGLLFLIFSVLLLNSILFGPKDSGTVFCGTMAVFSLFLPARCLSAVLFAACGASDTLLLCGSCVLSLLGIALLLCTPLLDLIHEIVQTGGVTSGILSSDLAILLMAALHVLSFDVQRVLSHIWLIAVLLLALLLADSILLFSHRRRVQEQKRIHMIEQYVPIVEELISQVRARQHEFHNRILAIEAAVTAADTLEEARTEVAALTKGIAMDPNDRELLSCDSKIIAGMLFGKRKQAEAAGIHMELQLHGLFRKTATPETEWIEAIGILVDNAIEASPRGSTVYVSSRTCESALELLVSNPAPPMSNTEFMALFRSGFTTKSDPEGHGFGLYNILRLTERYHGKILTHNERIAEENYVVFGVRLP